MLNSKHVIIFARAPHYGRVKQRLARDIGDFRACQYYRQNLRSLISELRTGPWNLHISLASAQDAKHPMFTNLSTLVQPQGDLGHRMRSSLAHFDNKHVVIVGSDIHRITRVHLKNAFSVLGNHDVVFGPAFDGGFWLVGSGPTHTPGRRFMRGVRWSTRFAFQDSLATVSSACRVGQVSYLHDIDNGKTYDQFYGH